MRDTHDGTENAEREQEGGILRKKSELEDCLGLKGTEDESQLTGKDQKFMG